jgi:tRNA modification GTPase
VEREGWGVKRWGYWQNTMYELNDTILAVSSASVMCGRVSKSIIRMSGAGVFAILSDCMGVNEGAADGRTEVVNIAIDNDLEVDAALYKFCAPHSYTGEDLAEIHVFASGAVVEKILERFGGVARLAGPGEFTLRAYLNGQLDLAQAEAVAEIVASSNKVQLEAAERLLAGKLSESISQLRSELLEVLSLIEGGLDFSTEEKEFITNDDAVERITGIKDRLGRLLSCSIRCEELIEMPSVGLAGATNAGKSSLLNALVGKERSIVSSEEATTRDVLTGIIELENFDCAIFDCAGLSLKDESFTVLEDLAREAAIEALGSAHLVVLCVDASKDNYNEDVEIRKLIDSEELILAATKCDVLDDVKRSGKFRELAGLFSAEPTATSAQTGEGLERLRSGINARIVGLMAGSDEGAERIGITERHRRLVEEALKNLSDAAEEIRMGNDEICSMLLRTGYEELSGVEREDVDEAILERIFSTFCIGK